MIDNFPSAEENVSMTPRWMVSFADLLSLILTFFVLMFSMAVPPDQTDEANNDMSGKYPTPYSVQKEEGEATITVAKTDLGLSTDYLYDIIRDQTNVYPSLAKLKVRSTDDNLTLSIQAKDFDLEMADAMAHLLKNMNNRMALYTSRLDVSEAVVKKLQEKGMDKDISFFESASTRNKIDIIIYP